MSETRPTARRAAAAPKKTTRYTLDLDPEQRRFLRLWSVQHEVTASKAMRALLLLLEAGTPLPAGATLGDLVLDELFGDIAPPDTESTGDDATSEDVADEDTSEGTGEEATDSSAPSTAALDAVTDTATPTNDEATPGTQAHPDATTEVPSSHAQLLPHGAAAVGVAPVLPTRPS